MTSSGVGHTLVVVLFVSGWATMIAAWFVGATNLFRFMREIAAEPSQVKLQKTFGLASVLTPQERLHRQRVVRSLLVFLAAFVACALTYWLGRVAGVS